jgi:D-3-phosphoglycerate dehydrogenase
VKKFVMLDSHTLPGDDFHQEKEIISANGHKCVLAQCRTFEEAVETAKDADCIGDNYFKIDDRLLSRLPKCTAIVRYGIGYDVVDTEAATKRNIAVCNLPEFCTVDVATHTLAFILDMCRKITIFDRRVRAGEWNVSYGYPVHRLNMLTLGLLGFGNTAKIVSCFAGYLGLRIIASDPYQDAETFERVKVTKVEIDELYAQADIISVHVPAISETTHLICAESISKMKDGVMIVNTARGQIVNIKDLVRGLKSGKVRAAALDVVEGEPIFDMSHEMFHCENLIVTPHSAYNSVESSDDQHTQVAETVVKLFQGNMPQNTVNKKLLRFK